MHNGVCRDWRMRAMFVMARQGNREKTDSQGDKPAPRYPPALYKTMGERYLGILVTTSSNQPRQFLHKRMEISRGAVPATCIFQLKVSDTS